MLCIDSHLDLGYSALIFNRDLKQPVAAVRASEADMEGKGRSTNTVCFPEMRAGEVFLCFSTILARHASGLKSKLDYNSPEVCWAMGQAQLAYYRILEREGVLRMLTTAEAVDAHLAEWQRAPQTTPLGHVLSMEGADPILNPDQAFEWWEDGLRILSLAHYGPSHYAQGTDTSGGLHPVGYQLLANMEQLGMILDLTHLSDESFWEMLDRFSGRVLASHTNSRALAPHQRQFTDDQIQAIVARDGVIGIVLDGWQLYPDWEEVTSREIISLEDAVNHMDHICQLAGNARHVGLGSDLDGGFGTEQVPRGLDTIADLQRFPDLLRARGYEEADVEAIMFGNWLRLLREALPAQ